MASSFKENLKIKLQKAQNKCVCFGQNLPLKSPAIYRTVEK